MQTYETHRFNKPTLSGFAFRYDKVLKGRVFQSDGFKPIEETRSVKCPKTVLIDEGYSVQPALKVEGVRF